MNDEKKLDEKTLEEVTGGDLLSTGDPDIPAGSCSECACTAVTCPYSNNLSILLKKRSGEEKCLAYIPRT